VLDPAPALPSVVAVDVAGDYDFVLTFPETLDIDALQAAGRWYSTNLKVPESIEVELSINAWDATTITMSWSGIDGRTSGVIRYKPNEYPLKLASGYEYPAFEIPWSIP
jgi:hypothetical protein